LAPSVWHLLRPCGTQSRYNADRDAEIVQTGEVFGIEEFLVADFDGIAAFPGTRDQLAQRLAAKVAT
jgi:hypothetical protein